MMMIIITVLLSVLLKDFAVMFCSIRGDLHGHIGTCVSVSHTVFTSSSGMANKSTQQGSNGVQVKLTWGEVGDCRGLVCGLNSLMNE